MATRTESIEERFERRRGEGKASTVRLEDETPQQRARRRYFDMLRAKQKLNPGYKISVEQIAKELAELTAELTVQMAQTT